VHEVKSLLFVHTRSPHGSINAQEGLDALLMGSAFADCRALFLGDGILQLLRNQDTDQISQKNFSLTFSALHDYGVEEIYCSRTHLQNHGIIESDLVIEVISLSDEDVASLLSSSEVILNF
jgi:tRNA 2-thiouridine synthesizing protein C